MTPELYHIFLKTVILFSRPSRDRKQPRDGEDRFQHGDVTEPSNQTSLGLSFSVEDPANGD